MKEKKDQFVIAYIADFNRTDVVTSHALFLSRALKKGLVLLHICDPRYSGLSADEAVVRLQQLQESLRPGESATPPVSYMALPGKTADVINALPTLLGAVVIVAQVDRRAPRRSAVGRTAILHNFADCKTAFLVAQQPLSDPSRMANVAMAVDFRKESKDKFIWSSYFPRFCHSTMHVLYYDYKDELLKNKWYANMKQLHKLYTDLDIGFQPHIIGTRHTYMDRNALEYAAAQGYGMLIAVTTKEKDGLEFFIGVQERRTIVNREQIPILFLNPREDLYVLCD